MPEPQSILTSSIIVGEAHRLLEEGGYRIMRDLRDVELPRDRSLVAEDEFGIVALVVYEQWSELTSSWPLAQGVLVEQLSKKLNRSDPKIWEGYLVLMNPLPATEESRREIERIRSDVSRVRKFVASGESLKTLSDVERVLLPLLPINIEGVGVGPTSLLDTLPDLLSRLGVDRGAAQTVVESFKRQEPLLERLHHYQGRQGGE